MNPNAEICPDEDTIPAGWVTPAAVINPRSLICPDADITLAGIEVMNPKSVI